MRLILKNFRCWIDKEFEFPDSGLVLLNGRSGAGKSTLLTAIEFALFGDVRKPFAHGKKDCSVELHISGLKIFRQKGPNRLLVNDVYEDDEGQGFLEKSLGLDRVEFKISSFMKQNAYSSLLALNPSEQMKLIEQIAFDQSVLEVARKKIKGQIKERNEIVKRMRTELEFAERELEENRIEGTKIDKPVSNIKRWRKRRDKIITMIAEHIQKKEKLLKDEGNARLLISAKSRYDEEKLHADEQRRSIEEELGLVGTIWPDRTSDASRVLLKQYQSWIAYETKKKAYESEVEKYKDMENEEIVDIQVQIDELKALLWTEGEPMTSKEKKDELQRTINSLYDRQRTQNDLLIAIDEIKGLDKNIELEITFENAEESGQTLKEEWENTRDELIKKQETDNATLARLELEKSLKICPNCDAVLKIEKNKLVCVDGDHEAGEKINVEALKDQVKIDKITLQQLIKRLASLDNLLSRISKIRKAIEKTSVQTVSDKEIVRDSLIKQYETELKTMKTYISDNEVRERRVTRFEEQIKKKSFSKSLQSFKKELLSSKKDLTSLRESIEEPSQPISHSDIVALQDYINDNEELEEKVTKLKQKLGYKNESLERAKANLDKIRKECGMTSRDDIPNKEAISKKITQLEKDLIKLEKAKLENDEMAESVSNYEEQQKVIKKRKKYKSRIGDINASIKEADERLVSSMTLKERSSHAEALTIERTVDNVNEHAKMYLEEMFAETPISVTLQTYKELKTKKTLKPKINTVVNYKGNDTDLDSLSGGELDRCYLAYEIALNTMFNSPILMLDECIASLDTEKSTDILNSLKDLSRNKLVIVIAHQVTTGLFDDVIEVL